MVNPSGTNPTLTNVTILRLPTTALVTYPRLHELVALLNLAFTTSWHSIPGLVGDDAKRYETDEQFVDDMGKEGATWLAFDGDEDGGKLIATAGYKPWDTHWKTLERVKTLRGNEAEDGGVEDEVDQQVEKEKKEVVEAAMDKHEVVAVVVDPTLQNMGLASRLCGEIDKELRERAKRDGKKKVSLMIRAGKENVAEYWTRKGYRTLHETHFPIGNFGSKTGFSLLDMERILEV